jgi:hypothetical protein
MTTSNYRNSVLGCALLLLTAQAAVAESIEYTGRIYADRSANLLPLGNGNGAMTVEAAGIAAMSMSGSAPSVFKLGCAGLGLVDTEGEATMDVYCTFTESDTDAFDLKGKVHKGEGSFDVIGGSGRFAGATGTAKYKRNEAGEDGTGVIEVKIRTK